MRELAQLAHAARMSAESCHLLPRLTERMPLRRSLHEISARSDRPLTNDVERRVTRRPSILLNFCHCGNQREPNDLKSGSTRFLRVGFLRLRDA